MAARIDNPIVNSPFAMPERRWKFDRDGITDEILAGRRPSARFVPIAKSAKKGKQPSLLLNEEWTGDRLEENQFVNDVRKELQSWRDSGRRGLSSVSTELLEHWSRPERERRLYWCQIEALETAMFLTEVAAKVGCAWIENKLTEVAGDFNAGLYRLAFKLATGTGKTAVMAMIIAWQVLNRQHDRTKGLFSECFLVVAPGLTIKDRLRVLLPNDPDNVYAKLDLVPPERMGQLAAATIVITNYHTFLPRELGEASKLTKAILTANAADKSAFRETPDQVARRVCRPFGNRKNIVVLNDEAHHCYMGKTKGTDEDAAEDAEKLSGEEKREAKQRNEDARVWLSGLHAIARKLGIRAVYDLSATPFFLSGSGYGEGFLFPWVVSDFSLIDAIEAGIVKVPRVPVEDNAGFADKPMYRELWPHIKDDLPKKNVKETNLSGPPILPAELEGALHSLYGHYEKDFDRWEADADARKHGRMPPVFIVVCNNTATSKLVYDYIAGVEIGKNELGAVASVSNLLLFSNAEAIAGSAPPVTLLVDSEQLERDDAMSDDVKKLLGPQIAQWKHELKARFPGRDPEAVTDKDLLREVMNTVGKKGKLGESIRCVVSVSMLTEGWDVNTVTHILGVRAFGTQLLCEQVVGRGLRRTTFATEMRTLALPGGAQVDIECFPPEYADVYGVPFQFIQAGGTSKISDAKVTRVQAVPERDRLAIRFPRVAGYQWELPRERLAAKFTETSEFLLTTFHLATATVNAPVVGRAVVHDLEGLRDHREQEVAFRLSKLVLEKYFRTTGDTGAPTKETDTQEALDRVAGGDDARQPQWDPGVQAWRFPEVLAIAKQWMAQCVVCAPDTFVQLLLLIEHAHDAADKIYASIERGVRGEKKLRAILRRFEPEGTTVGVAFDTRKQVFETRAGKCHFDFVACDTDEWEQVVAQQLEGMAEVDRYAKNERLGFSVPYTIAGKGHQYYPDFIVCIDDGRGDGDLLNLLVECSGKPKADKPVKVGQTEAFWCPAVTTLGSFGRWDIVEVKDPWATAQTIRSHLAGRARLAGRAAVPQVGVLV